ncbi:MAG: hypothetical protein GY806_02070 [Gammaproteobacteria bacterium]|nr:hypothetical protein [Gammaproteobacteria bacterium]
MTDKNPITLLLCSGFMVMMTACSSHIPPGISEPIAGSADINQVLSSPDAFYSSQIRWAGIVLSIENTKDQSKLTIVSFPTNDNGRPIASADSPGRFIAVVDEFLEPLVYRQDREITVVGRFDRLEAGKVGEFEYDFPLVNVDEFYLWPQRAQRVDYPQPYYRPFIYPYFPFYPWPYHHFHYHRHIRH